MGIDERFDRHGEGLRFTHLLRRLAHHSPRAGVFRGAEPGRLLPVQNNVPVAFSLRRPGGDGNLFETERMLVHDGCACSGVVLEASLLHMLWKVTGEMSKVNSDGVGVS